ncbi:hypothetical protein [Niveibacterium sp. SC-1]|uniref:hypothetical protein n=1 Tax=Niveibacterium sp. SC-1 TaxID=3135646 RepID=UPI00311EB1E9
MGVPNRLVAFRWSLYVVHDSDVIAYAMHADSVIGILYRLMYCYRGGAQPLPSWSLVLKFNHTQAAIPLRPAHFTADGASVTPELLATITAADPGWNVSGGELFFEDAVTRRRLTLSHFPRTVDLDDATAQIEASFTADDEVTFYSVMARLFG